MKKLGRSSEKLETLNLFSRLQQRGGPTIYDPANKKSFLERIEIGLDKGLLASSTLHGVRVELLFQFMVANIGKVKLIKEEDTGDCFYSGEPLMVPDYRVVLENGMNLLIEVKNHFHKDPMRPFKLKSSYVESLQRFAELVGTPLKVAIYWARWNKWSLNDPQRFKTNGAYKELALSDAFIKNEMALLGDIAIGTVPPLQLRFKDVTQSSPGMGSERHAGAYNHCGI